MGKKVLISIDTEAPCGNKPVEHLIYGITRDGKRAGIELLMDIFDRNSVKGLFFVDIAEAWEYGKEKIEGVLKLINSRGHDLGVHIHPDHMADKNRRFLWQYTYDEQYEIISKCTDYYVSTLGRMPLSFRAGRYGLNYDTLNILNKVGYRFDMSEFYGNKKCHLNPPITCNKIVRYRDILEIPVTTYKSFKSPFYERFDKMDVNMNRMEFDWIIEKMINDDNIDIISFFVHSFSMLDWRKNVNSPRYLEKEAKKIDYMIKKVKRGGGMFVDESYLLNTHITYHNIDKITDYSGNIRSYMFFILRAVKVVKDRLENNI